MTALMRLRAGALLAIACVSGTAADAQTGRDPTQPPPAYATPTPAPAPATRQPTNEFRFEHLVSVNGVLYLIWNSRRYAAGDSINGARIERISENAIWLRAAGGVRKISLFPSIEKRPLDNGSVTSPNSSKQIGLGEKNGPTK